MTNAGTAHKVIVSMNITLDGYLSGPACELDWHFRSWTAETAGALACNLSRAGTLLFGRITYEAMARHFGGKEADPYAAREDLHFVHLLNEVPKLVLSGTLQEAAWKNSEILHGTPASHIHRLKRTAGGDILIYGSSRLVGALQESDLIDEYQLWLHPVILGKGKPMFKCPVHLHLESRQEFDSGVVLLVYARQQAIRRQLIPVS
jgi:dihydrofolate reductase